MAFSIYESSIERETLVEVVQTAIDSLKIKFSKQSIEELLLRHPNYPNLPALLDTLSSLKIDNKAVKLLPEQLSQLQPNFFAHLPYEGIVFVRKMNEETITYFSPISGWIEVSTQDFVAKWSGIVVLFNTDNVSAEKDYSFKKFVEVLRESRFLSIIIISLLPLLLNAIAYNFTLFTPFLFIKSIGVILCIVLSIATIDKSTIFFRHCRRGAKMDCRDVLESPASKVFGWVSMSDIGLGVIVKTSSDNRGL